MKTLITIALILLVVVPVVGYTASGIVKYQTYELGKRETITRYYDYDEGVICYLYKTHVRYETNLTCVKDN